MESEIIFHGNNATPVYESDLVVHSHYPHHVTQESTHMVSQENHMIHHEPVPVTSPATTTNYDTGCWHFMPPDYPYSEEDFKYVGLKF